MRLGREGLAGIFPALTTPTDANGEVDAKALSRLVDYVLAGGASGLVPVGGTGEFTALSPAARLLAVETTIAAAKARVPIVPGILSPGFAEAVATGKAFAAAGADALMLIVPFYVTPTQAGIRDYFRAFRDKIDRPLLLYDIPSRTYAQIDPETIAELAEDHTIIGMKACNTSIPHFNRVIHRVGNRIAVMSGEDEFFPTHAALGATGGVLASATMIPRYWVEMLELIRAGKLSEALLRHRRLLPLFDALFAETNPGPLKEAMRRIGFDIGQVLPPLQPPGAATVTKLDAAIAGLRSANILPLAPKAA